MAPLQVELKYDSVFKFANIKIANVSGELTSHPYRLIVFTAISNSIAEIFKD
jgi:hypothetical protein